MSVYYQELQQQQLDFDPFFFWHIQIWQHFYHWYKPLGYHPAAGPMANLLDFIDEASYEVNKKIYSMHSLISSLRFMFHQAEVSNLKNILWAPVIAGYLSAKERPYPELLQSRRCKLVVLAIEASRRWSQEATTFLRLLAEAKARTIPARLKFFFFSPHLFPRLAVALNVVLGSLQAHDWHEGHEGQNQGPGMLRKGGEVTGGRRMRRGFREELAPVDGIGVDVVEIGCSFTKKGGCEGGHGCMGQRGGPTCGESGCNALLEDGGCLCGFGFFHQLLDPPVVSPNHPRSYDSLRGQSAGICPSPTETNLSPAMCSPRGPSPHPPPAEPPPAPKEQRLGLGAVSLHIWSRRYINGICLEAAQ